MKISRRILLDKLEGVFETGLIIGLSTFILSYSTILFWQRDGFDFLEVSMMTILTGIYLFLLLIPSNIILLNRDIKRNLGKGVVPIRRVYQVLLSFFIALLLYLLIDSLVFLVDDSLPVAFAKALQQLAENSNESVKGIEEFARLPFSIQNGIMTFSFGLIGALISLAFLKKDGELLASKSY